MKKLGVILLATVFVLGLAAQASADVDLVGVNADVFAGVDPITFDDVFPGEEILSKYWLSSGVNFSDGVYGDNLSFFSWIYFGNPAVSNLYVKDIQQQMGGTPLFQPVITLDFRETIIGVGFDVRTTGGSIITVVVFRDGADPFEFTHDTTQQGTFIGIQDLEGIDSIEISGDGQYADFVGVLFMNDLILGDPLETGPADIEVEVEIKPPNCLGAQIPLKARRINDKSRGVTPVVIVGNETYDVTQIDPSTIRLQGVEPLRDAIEDASHCNAEEGDEELDLTLKFDTQKLAAAIEDSFLAEGKTLNDGDMVALHLTGNLYDDTQIKEKKDSVWVTVLVKGKH